MEFGLGAALPIYASGLDILAGDYLKTASNLGLPIVGVGLLYQEGYFHQMIDSEGRQLAIYLYNEPATLPIQPVRTATGNWLQIPLSLLGRQLMHRVWQVNVGRVQLSLLDSNDLLNNPRDRGITKMNVILASVVYPWVVVPVKPVATNDLRSQYIPKHQIWAAPGALSQYFGSSIFGLFYR